MKKIYDLFLKACMYTVLMTIFLCVFVSMVDTVQASISITQFLLVLLFGCILAVSGEIHRVALSPMTRRMLHYAILTVSFLVLSVISGKIAFKGAPLLIAFFLFSLVYTGFALVIWLIQKKQRNDQAPPLQQQTRTRSSK